ncbi:zinc-dependent metalloprotease [Ekhidna sp.]|uniref:zinc-dependent metalloprotease n=1 Tax=Ekhidna sp. TaxID=2608089 RepID=UPI003BA85932
MRTYASILTSFLIILIVGCQSTNTPSSTGSSMPSDGIAGFTSEMQKQEGFFNFYYDEEVGRMFLEVDKIGQEFLYVNSLAAGIGSNDIGLDRGQLGAERVVKFEKHGNKLLLIQPNYDYRAVSDNQDEVKSVAEAFASSVIGGFEITTKNDKAYLIDITDFLLQDSHDVSGRLRGSNQGNFSIDKSRSAIYMDATFNFPKNTEFESILTFKGDAKGWWLRSVTPTPDAVTVRTHHSFIELPDDNYTPRVFDPRSGFFNISYQDYATPIEEPLVKRFIVRHRLEKKDPNAEVSEAVEPIIYYVDRGAPEPVRSALIEGASWWNQAFEAAGYKDAFQVKVMPEGAHPLDVRYNVIQWVHRSTRGWSYGGGVTDPRTGEMIKGHVSLGSLRVRQDFLIATGLLQPYVNGDETPNAMTEMALARLRQLSAHEVGHTIGLAHNFAASVNNRASVMDYPHPYIKLDDNGNIDLSEAYDDKIGAWDKITIQYGYSDFPEGENQVKLNEMLVEAFAKGAKYITDQDARPTSGLHPNAHLWDNGSAPNVELDRMMKIRRKVLDDFSAKAIRNGMPMSTIEEVLVPIYLLHRYQVDAISKVIGGLDYAYNLRGDFQASNIMLEPSWQMNALNSLLNTVAVENLKLSEEILGEISPRAFGYPRSRETFQSKTGPAFDYLAAVETAASVPFSFLFNADRFNRLLTYKARSEDQPGVDQVLDKTIDFVWKNPANKRVDRTIQRVVEMEMLDHLMGLAVNDRAYDEVKAKTFAKIKEIRSYASARTGRKTNEDGVYYQYVTSQIDRFMEEPDEFKISDPIKAPDGSPIGSCDF